MNLIMNVNHRNLVTLFVSIRLLQNKLRRVIEKGSAIAWTVENGPDNDDRVSSVISMSKHGSTEILKEVHFNFLCDPERNWGIQNTDGSPLAEASIIQRFTPTVS